MSSDPKESPTLPPVGSAVTSAKPQHSNRASPYPPNTTTATSVSTPGLDNTVMATTATFLPPTSHAFRPGPSGQAQYPLGMPAVGQHFDRDAANPIGTPFSSSPAPPMVRILIRRLPLNTSEESLRLMVVWSKELVDVQLLSAEQSEDNGFRSALMRFRSMTGALEAKKMLDGRSNISNDAQMVVEILGASPVASRRHVTEPQQPATNGSGPSGSRQPAQFNGVFSPLENMPPPPPHNGLFSQHEFGNGDATPHYQNIFSSQSPIGNHLNDRTRVSSKSLINNDFADDDETSNLLKDPVAYAESNASSQRRATAPQIPIGRMANLSLNTNAASPPGPSSLPPYMNSLSPVNSNGPATNYPMPGHSSGPGPAQHYQRPNFPPVNPADQNPPCNTLYVGNLPIDTSEEELKAMFSKQRGYKRLCFRTKQNGPMCFVEFEDISFATKALHELYGHLLHNSVKGGIRLSFSKNPLGVRSGQAPSQAPSIPMPNANGGGMGSNAPSGFSTNGPPPGLSAPPGLGTGRAASYSNGHSPGHGGPGAGRGFPFNGFPTAGNNPWNNPGFSNGVAAGPNSAMNGNSNYLPRHMMGR